MNGARAGDGMPGGVGTRGIRLRGVGKSFGALRVLDALDAEFPASSVTAVIGPSGCGKTTLLHILAGLLQADAGTVDLPAGITRSYAFQEPRLLSWMSAEANIRYATEAACGREESCRRTAWYLEKAGLAGFAKVRPPALSGGMRQRLSLARAFAFPSELLLLDEAFSSVDLAIKIGLMDLFRDLWESERRTTVLVTHDIQEAVYLADRVLVMRALPSRIIAEVPIVTPRTSRKFGSTVELESEALLYDLALGRVSGP